MTSERKDDELTHLGITPESCLLWLNKFNHMEKLCDSLIEDKNKAISRCERLEEENKHLKIQLEIIKHLEMEQLIKENEKLKKELEDLKQKESLISSSFIKMTQTCEAMYTKMSMIPSKAESIASFDLEHDQISFQDDEMSCIFDMPQDYDDTLAFIAIPDNTNLNAGAKCVTSVDDPPKVCDDVAESQNVQSTSETASQKSIEINKANVSRELINNSIKVNHSTPATVEITSKRSKEKQETSDDGISEDIRRMDKYYSVASKRKLANEITYSQNKKVKLIETVLAVESSLNDRLRNEDQVDDVAKVTQEPSMSIFTQRKLVQMSDRHSNERRISDCNLSTKEKDSSNTSNHSLRNRESRFDTRSGNLEDGEIYESSRDSRRKSKQKHDWSQRPKERDRHVFK